MKRIKSYSLVAMGAIGMLVLASLSSHKAEAQIQGLNARATPIGSWYGQALPENPATAPFPSVWMMPTLFADGNVMANDSHELNSPHTTAHGNWYWTGPNTIHAVFFWINFAPLGTPDGLGGNFRVTFDGVMDPKDPDHMAVKIHPLAFAPGQNALDPKTVPAVDGGIFSAPRLTRLVASKY